MKLPEKITNLQNEMVNIDGIGSKTAMRYINSILTMTDRERDDLSIAIKEINNITYCKQCGFFADEDHCNICLDEERKAEKFLCVVENMSDLMAIEKTSVFKGQYFILGGVLNPLMGIGPNELNLKKLFEIITNNSVERVLLALNPSIEGDATCTYIKDKLPEVTFERIGFGIPVGGHLEYLDSSTISSALENRKSL